MASSQQVQSAASGRLDWPVYGGNPENNHYSVLAQINRDNVSSLQMAWSYDTGEEGGLQTSPIVVEGVLYGVTPTQKVFALDAATGKELWKFDSGIAGTQPARGLAFWQKGKDRRILVGIMHFLYALNAETGKPLAEFAENGRIDLRKDLGRPDYQRQFIALTTPGTVYKDLIIVGGRLPEELPGPPGDIRAYEIPTGKLRWSFHTIPHPGEYGYDTWPKDAWTYSSGANNWAGMALDVARGILYVPTGSAASDFYGADRAGDNLFANSLLALNAETGERIWHFQAVKHDLWDRDFPSPPALVTVKHDGKRVDAIAETSKQGFVYLFDRSNGAPLFPLTYKKYPASTVPEEWTANTQGLPAKPAPFARQSLTSDLLTTRTSPAHAWAVKEFATFRNAGQFAPLTANQETVIFPGFDGGAEWGGFAVDPGTAVLYVNSNDVAWTGSLVKSSGGKAQDAHGLYLSQCSVCHGADRAGSPPQFPSLVNIGQHTSPMEIENTITHGKGRMPAFPALSGEQVRALIAYLTTGEKRELTSGEVATAKYYFTGYHKFLDPEGYPAVAPPWGTLNAIDLNSGEYVWKIPLGEYPELAAQGQTNTGTENYGGPMVTAGGLLFIGATNFDKKLRAFDKDTGKLLWETLLPFSGNATPATYEVDGRQYVVIAAGGGKAGKAPSGGVYVAFALPRK
ncbi:MAG: PQQ-binding-like beta-propeller repeat protein [Acidobacteria bacterium]|nr:PQQ-binding-like beta-propeller repeat protein [Acidobacteriota bacterium]